jgi:hypothetical protein
VILAEEDIPMDEQIKKYILTRTLPNALDVEVAKRILLDHIDFVSQGQNNLELFSGSQLVNVVEQQSALFANPTSIQPGYENLENTLTSVKAAIAAREALALLQGNGVLIPFGELLTSPGPYAHSIEKRFVNVQTIHNIDRYEVPLPAIQMAYRLATQFREGQISRLASGDVYLSYLDQGKLPSRAKRCLRECIDAYRHGLYLSATMAVGAASESLWMQLARLVQSKKPAVATKVAEQLKKISPSISSSIEETWQVLVSNFDTQLDQVFSNRIARRTFKEQADRLFDRRNYAMHSEEADEDEPLFSYNETGMLLLESIKYFNQLAKITEVIEASP